jgi:hypothetical protein
VEVLVGQDEAVKGPGRVGRLLGVHRSARMTETERRLPVVMNGQRHKRSPVQLLPTVEN